MNQNFKKLIFINFNHYLITIYFFCQKINFYILDQFYSPLLINSFHIKMENKQDFTVDDIGVKCRSKREVYTVLSTEGGIFLPLISDATQKYLRAIMLGDKNYVKCTAVKVVRVPHLEGLRIKDILSWARERIDIDRYIPD